MTDKEERKPHKRQMIGTVISDKMDKSIVVSVERLKQHRIYKKYIKRSKRYIAHDEKNECKTGDMVKIIETRPISKHKTWKLVEIIERAK
ncbi:MAG: 30S ribosomal protein S17 [Spirochaetota bacterium]|nr:MAG: 30S ribosomal protein S17 [Spirochaetota bacterium]